MALLSSIPGILLIIFGFGVLIFVHELGHFLAAKWAGIRTEAFAVGMGPVAVSWRKGVGLAFGSTERRVVAIAGKAASELSEAELAKHGLGETEYSLRYLPIGGFVKMLGQDDMRPADQSGDSRSYNVCPIGKRMVVVSAGVVMNVILALLLFVVAFLVGVKFEAPVIGLVNETAPAGMTVADNAVELGVTEPGLATGDVVRRIDGKDARTFADLQISAAMGRPDRSISIVVDRAGVAEPLRFSITPRHDPALGLLSIGVTPAMSTTLLSDPPELIAEFLDDAGLYEQGVRPGMTLVSVGGAPVSTLEQMQLRYEASGGETLATRWVLDPERDGDAHVVEAMLPAVPGYAAQIYPEPAADGKRDFEMGLFGLSPLARIKRVTADCASADLIRAGDIVVGIGALEAPRQSDLIRAVREHDGATIPLKLMRDGAIVSIDATLNRKGMLGVELTYAWDDPLVARPLDRVAPRDDSGVVGASVPSPVGTLPIGGGWLIARVDDTPVGNWSAIRSALRAATADEAAAGTGASVEIAARPPGETATVMTLALSADDVRGLHELNWQAKISDPRLFEPVYTTLSAEGSPLLAVSMGFRETHKMIAATYLTIDRLFRGTVGVEQLRGPVGIIDLGSKILPKGFMFFLFFLGMISVNLAVLNFLPLPIVDGGLFLFLIYEKIKGRPPSVQFQNIATLAGLFLIGTIFVVTFYNDIMRLL